MLIPLGLLALLLLSLSLVPRLLGVLYLSGEGQPPLPTPTFQAGPITVVTPAPTPEATPSATPQQSIQAQNSAPAQPPVVTAPPAQTVHPLVTAPPVSHAVPANVALTFGNPAGEVAAFYQYVQAHNFSAAQSTWSASMQSRYPPDVYIVGRFQATQSITLLRNQVISNNGQVAYVAVDLIEVTNSGTRHWVGSWQLVRSGSGWLLNQPYFG